MPGALVLLTGRSFSGKSTLATAIAISLGASVLAYDAINEERGWTAAAGSRSRNGCARTSSRISGRSAS